MEFLRITASNGVKTYIPDNYVAQITVAADTGTTASDYAASTVVRGKITGVKYYDGANATAGALVVVTDVSAAKYEYGCFTVDGAFVTALSN
jgi:hypothetical protein